MGVRACEDTRMSEVPPEVHYPSCYCSARATEMVDLYSTRTKKVAEGEFAEIAPQNPYSPTAHHSTTTHQMKLKLICIIVLIVLQLIYAQFTSSQAH